MDSRPVTRDAFVAQSVRAAARQRRLSTGAALVALVAATVGFAPMASADAAAGEDKAALCAGCHGGDGNSIDPQWPSLAGQHATYTTKQLANFKAGERDNAVMAGMVAGLEEQDMRDIADFYATQVQAPNVATDREKAALGEKLFRAGNAETGVAACMACHGPQGAGMPAAGWPRLAGQHKTYLVAQLQAFRGGQRANDINGMMRGVARFLSDDEIDALAEYLTGLQ